MATAEPYNPKKRQTKTPKEAEAQLMRRRQKRSAGLAAPRSTLTETSKRIITLSGCKRHCGGA